MEPVSAPVDVLFASPLAPAPAFGSMQRAARTLARYSASEAAYLRMMPRPCPEALQPEDTVEGALQRFARARLGAPLRLQASLQFLGLAVQRILRTHLLPETPAPTHTGLLYLEGPPAPADAPWALSGLDEAALRRGLFGEWRAENRLVLLPGSLSTLGLGSPRLDAVWSTALDEAVLLVDFFDGPVQGPWS
jgi:hypothetical protein